MRSRAARARALSRRRRSGQPPVRPRSGSAAAARPARSRACIFGWLMARLKDHRLRAVLLVTVLVATACGPKTVRVEGNAMAPGLKSGQILVVNTGAYDSASPKRGDIVLFNLSGERIQRIIGLPGEAITIANGSV